MAPLPPIAPYPAIGIRNKIPPADWSTALTAYNAVLARRISLPLSALLSDTTLHAFIHSYFHELSHVPPSTTTTTTTTPTPESKQLKQSSFRLLNRILTSPVGAKLPQDLITGQFLLNLAVCLPKSAAVRNTLDTLWANHHGSVEESISSFKGSVVLPQLLPGKQSLAPRETQSLLRSLSILFLVSPRIGEFFIAGSDFLDALIDLYTTACPALRKSILRITHAGFTSLLPPAKPTVDDGSTPRKPNYSLFLDHLYSLQSHQPGSKEHTFLSALTSSTTFLDRLYSAVLVEPNPRLTLLTSTLKDKYKAPRRPQQKSSAADKGKGKSTNDEPTIPNNLLVQHTLQVLEVFPELSTSWVRTTLTKLNGDVESLVRGCLDGTIYNENPTLVAVATPTSPHRHRRRNSLLAPRPPNHPVRKNVHDNDDLDTLSANALGSLHIGKKDSSTQVAEPDSTAKAAIWAALEAFDGDDDERDDTYDVADVGGAVDATNTEPGPAAPPPPTTFAASAQQDALNSEKILYTLWTTSTPAERAVYFARDSATRRSNTRGDLKRKTGWSDEAIEGWGVMLDRDVAGRRMRDLERRFGEGGQAGGGNLNAGAIGRTRWRQEDGEEDSGGGNAYRGGRGGGGRGRGRGGWGGRGGASGSGTADAPRDRARKEASKSSRANHSRREGHARKMARGMGGGPVG